MSVEIKVMKNGGSLNKSMGDSFGFLTRRLSEDSNLSERKEDYFETNFLIISGEK